MQPRKHRGASLPVNSYQHRTQRPAPRNVGPVFQYESFHPMSRQARFTKIEIERLVGGMRAAGYTEVEIIVDHCGRIIARGGMTERKKSSWDDYRDETPRR